MAVVSNSSVIVDVKTLGGNNGDSGVHSDEHSIESNPTGSLNNFNLNHPKLNLQFENISYTVKTGIFGREEKCILKKVCGNFQSGDLTAILGPSGAGKSTLLDILSGYTYLGVNGEISINGVPRNFKNVRTDTCYIMQDDNLQPLLTVQESMRYAANLKLPTNLTKSEKGDRIYKIIDSIGLKKCRDQQTRFLSGGQKRRLSIALELLRNPPVMFFDEPTSGLDSSSSKQCIKLLQELAHEGRNIICTIHQPSAGLLELFDHLYIIADGSCIYQGCQNNLIPYLAELNLRCPQYHNPADFVMEICQKLYGNVNLDDLIAKAGNGRNPEWRRQIKTCDSFESYSTKDKILLDSPKVPLLTKPLSEAITTPGDAGSCFKSELRFPTSFFQQFYILLSRTFLILSRDRTLTYSRILIHLVIALFIGVLYYRIGDDAMYMLDNCNYLFFSIMFLMFTAFSSMTLTFPLEVPIISVEHFNRWYSLKSYYLARTVSDMPVQILCTTIYVVVTFYLTSQPFEAFRFWLFLASCVILSLVSQSIGVLCGSVMDLNSVTIFGPFAICPFLMFSGFFIHFNDVQPWLRWLFHTSFLKHAFEGALLSIFGYDRPRLPCSSDYCHFISPSKFLDEIAMPNADYGHAMMFLIVLYFVLRTVTYLLLLYRLQHNR